MDQQSRIGEDQHRELRRVLGSFGTGVTVVTSCGPDGRPVGVTANSFTSVSLDPPIVVWSLQATSPSLDAFLSCGRFVINVLALEQSDLSRSFARPSADKFAGVLWHASEFGLPVLESCGATIECRLIESLAVGDHVMLLGGVERHARRDKEPLIYCRGNYSQAVELSTPGFDPSAVKSVEQMARREI